MRSFRNMYYFNYYNLITAFIHFCITLWKVKVYTKTFTSYTLIPLLKLLCISAR